MLPAGIFCTEGPVLARCLAREHEQHLTILETHAGRRATTRGPSRQLRKWYQETTLYRILNCLKIRSRFGCFWLQAKKNMRKPWAFARVAACGAISLLGMLDSWQSGVQADEIPYSRMAPIEQYLMERNAEIALARSAAPDAISRDATVLVLGRHGYVTAVQGKNGFVCMVERGWVGAFDWPEFWNPKTRGADCLNAPAARSILPLAEMRTTMVLAGRTQAQIIDSLTAALSKGEVPTLESGAMSYMMSKASYLTDQGDHNGPHLMFYIPRADAAVWGADLPGSPVGSGPYWFTSEKMSQAYKGLPPIRIFTVSVAKWSDGTAALAHLH